MSYSGTRRAITTGLATVLAACGGDVVASNSDAGGRGDAGAPDAVASSSSGGGSSSSSGGVDDSGGSGSSSGGSDEGGVCGTLGNACCNGSCSIYESCQGGKCLCSPGYADCGGMCADLQTDTNNCGACGVACLACGAGRCLAVLASGQTWPAGTPRSIAVDSTSVYWANEFQVMKVSILGGTPATVASASSVNGMAARDPDVYWTENVGLLLGAPVGGGAATTLATPAGLPNAIATDGANAYWTDGSGNVGQIPLSGGTATTLVSGQASSSCIATDGANVYWSANSGALVKTPIGGGAPTTLAPAQPNSTIGLAVVGGTAYWMTYGFAPSTATVMSVPITGGAPKTLASGQDAWSTFQGFAVDGQNIYWGTTDNLVRMPVGGGMPVSLLTTVQLGPEAITLDDTSVYFTATNGDILKVTPK